MTHDEHRRGWLETPLGRLIRFLGGIRFAIPVLSLVAVGMVWGTIREAQLGADAAGREVYGSWWFITLISLICMSLILSVATRWPWRRRHIGFITVHASLIVMIGAGFLSLFTKVEGEIVLGEGEATDRLRSQNRCIERLEHNEGEFTVLETVTLGPSDEVTVGAATLRILERWPNTRQEMLVLDDGVRPLHAIEVVMVDHDHLVVPSEGVWVGQVAPTEPAPNMDGIAVRVMPEGLTWVPEPPADTGEAELVFVSAQGDQYMLPAVGEPIGGSGWHVDEVREFSHAVIGAEGLSEGEPTRDNPATTVILSATDGTREKHTIFHRFPDSPHKKMIDGEDHSPYALSMTGGTSSGLQGPTIAFMRSDEGLSARFAVPGMAEVDFAHDGEFPWEIDLQGFKLMVLKDYANARGTQELVEAPEADENIPALRVEHRHGEEQITLTLPWGSTIPVETDEGVQMLRYGPETSPLPFMLGLDDFRKEDYPGSDMAMEYESDVQLTIGDAEPVSLTISMNKPLEHDGWKVYQAGFVGDSVTVLSVTKDPGLIPMYIGCTGLCIGIVMTFYSRTLSHGHPGIPAPFSGRRLHSEEGTNES